MIVFLIVQGLTSVIGEFLRQQAKNPCLQGIDEKVIAGNHPHRTKGRCLLTPLFEIVAAEAFIVQATDDS